MDEIVIVVFVFSSSYNFVVQTRSLIKKRLSITIIKAIKISYGIIIVTFSQFISLFLKLLLSKSFLLFFVLV